MGDGPGRYYHPGMFPIINQVANNRNLAPGTYDLWQLAPKSKDDASVKASISHYFTDPSSEDFKTRAFVFGNESARISGKVVVNQDGSKTFHGIEIRPFDTNFDFEHNTLNPLVEIPRELARRKYDPENYGVKYDIRFPINGTGRIYDPFTDSQLNGALHKEFVHPRSGPPWLLPSVTGKPPIPFVDEHGQYLDQTNGDSAQASTSPAAAPAGQFGSPANRNASDVGSWIASLAGVDPMNPTQPAPQPADKLSGIVSNQPMPD